MLFASIDIYRKGKKYTVLMDKEDREKFPGNINVTNNGYALIRVRKGSKGCELLHRVIMGTVGQPFSVIVDHINHNKLDCRKSNLRVGNRSQNEANGRPYKNNTTGYKGVYYCKNNEINPYHAYAREGGKKRHLGCFPSKEEAALAYNEFAKKTYGEFARLNEVPR